LRAVILRTRINERVQRRLKARRLLVHRACLGKSGNHPIAAIASRIPIPETCPYHD